MTFFNKITNLNDLKKEYKNQAKKLHPDAGGDAEEFKKMQLEFENLFYKYNNTNDDGRQAETPSNLINILNKLIFLFNNDNAEIEIVGSWVWISFKDKPETSIIDNLKKAGLRWSNAKKKWFNGGDNFKFRPVRSNFSFAEICLKHGSQNYKMEAQRALQ